VKSATPSAASSRPGTTSMRVGTRGMRRLAIWVAANALSATRGKKANPVLSGE